MVQGEIEIAGQNNRLCYLAERCVVTNIQEFEKHSEFSRGGNLATITWSLNSKTY